MMNDVPYRQVIATDEVQDCLETYERQMHPHREDGDRKDRKTNKTGEAEITVQGFAVS
jgi:hypothetical protein